MEPNERLDRIEQYLEALTLRQTDAEERFDRYAIQLAEHALREAQYAERHEREMAAIRGELHRAIRASVQEARSERRKRQEMDARWDSRMAQLTAALESFMKRGGNGQG